MEQVFNALGAQEFKAIIMKSIERGFDESGEFADHLTFPKVSWDFRLEVKVYPSASPDRVVVAKGQIERSPVTEDQARTAKIVTFSQAAGIDTPDLAREQNALPIPTPKAGADGIVGDVAILSPNEPDPIPVGIEVKQAVPGAEPVPEPKAVPVEDEDPNSIDPAMELAKSFGGTIPEEQKEQIYANATRYGRRDAKAASVAVATHANPKGVKVEIKGGTPVPRNK